MDIVDIGFSPVWPIPLGVHALMTTRQGGVSLAPYNALNLGLHVGDNPIAVAENRQRLTQAFRLQPIWLNQVHGADVVEADEALAHAEPTTADAMVAHIGAISGHALAIMVADCLPVLFCDVSGQRIGAAHAGWRGLAGGVLENTVQAMGVAPDRLLAYLGPAIGPTAFEVGGEVRAAFMQHDPQCATAFQLIQRTSAMCPPVAAEKYLANMVMLAQQRLRKMGVTQIFGGEDCTVTRVEKYFSYRRDGLTGRMAALIGFAVPCNERLGNR